MNIGTKFENELAKEFGLERVPGSGSTWHSKLDLYGNKARWSLKATAQPKFPIRLIDIKETLDACYGTGGTGETPLWAARTIVGDFIIMRKEDFMIWESEDGDKFINPFAEKPQVAERKKRAKTPELLRGTD